MTTTYRENSVIITGASSGIGQALALELAKQGAWLTLAARRLDALETIAETCRTLGGKAFAVQADVSEQAQCENLVRRAVETYGRVDTLVNNAGITMWSRFEKLDDPVTIERIMRVNFLGAMYCTYYAIPHLKQSRGRIACISSMADKIVAPGSSGYAASKHAMEGFFETLRAELKADGISVTMLYPGFVDTGFAGRMLDSSGQPSSGMEHMLGEGSQMPVAECAHWIADNTLRRKRQALMPVNGLPGFLLPWIKLIAPGLLERVGRQFMERSGI